MADRWTTAVEDQELVKPFGEVLALELTIGGGRALAPTLGNLAWLGGLLLIFVPLSVRALRRA